MKIYTKTGDKGTTSLLTGKRVSKMDLRLEAYGTVDELNSVLGWLAAGVPSGVFDLAHDIQSELFAMGSHLAVDGPVAFPMPVLNPELVGKMESQIDSWNAELPELKNFVLPGGSEAAARCHMARTVCRRAERLAVALAEEAAFPEEILTFLNRLSDFLFVMARWVLHVEGREAVIWTPKY
ncbi:MAG: hypothetical protein RL754_762 [Bacteroidota bacterium]|jgi:cob(I)alamin adenosyltransferase